MAKFELTFPISPMHVNQGFGGNSAYYAKFLDDNGNPEKGHSGVDLQAYTGQPVYAPFDGIAFNVGPDDHGGEGVYLRTQTPDDNGDYHTCIFWHLLPRNDAQHPCPIQGLVVVKRGDQIGWADNSGAPWESNGTHLHLGHALCDSQGHFKNRANGYNGCSDPTPYFNGQFASDTVINPAPAAINVAVIAAQNAQNGDLTTANMLYAILGLIRAFLGV